jgi:ethanolamine utilization protein EutQ
MSDAKVFRQADQAYVIEPSKASVFAFVNSGNSSTMGGGLGVFCAGFELEWTVHYDEFLFIHRGNFKLCLGEDIYHAGPGDTIWLPANTAFTYIAEEDVWFFFAVYPASASPSASQAIDYPNAGPQRVS